MRYLDPIQKTENESRAQAAIAWAVCSNRHLTDQSAADSLFRRAFGGRYDHLTTKAGVTVTDSGDVLAGTLPLVSGFLGEAAERSIRGRLDGPIRMDVRTAGRVQMGTVVGQQVGEGAPKPVVKLEFSAATAAPDKFSAEIVVSREAVQPLNAQALAGITTALVNATARADDDQFVAALLTAAGAPESSDDIGTLLSAITGGRPSRPALISDWTGLLGAAGSVQDLLALRELGVQVIVSPSASGSLIAVDAAGLMLSDLGAEITTALHALITLDDGTGGSPGTTVVSLWQMNLLALRAELWTKTTIRSGAVAYASLGS